MDLAPPQAPPAFVASTQQETIDGLARLVAAQGWLASQQQDLPVLPPRPTAEGRDGWLASLDSFWRQPLVDAPGSTPVARLDALATQLASIMRDEAIVQRMDGTLEDAAANLAERFVRSLGSNLPQGMEARSLRIGTAEYAGAIIVLDHGDANLVLRFMPDRGWDAFDSLDDLHTRTESLLRQALARRRELPGVRADDTQQVIADDRFVNSLPVQTDVLGGMARRFTALLREKAEDAWPSVDATALAIDLHDKLDVAAMLAERERRLAAAVDEQRLARVPADVAQGWRDAVEGYRLARLVSASTARQHIDESPLTLAAWCRKELVAALARRAIEVDPDALEVEASGTQAFTLPASGATVTTPRIRMSLAEFALRNTGYYDGRQLLVVTAGLPAGTPAPNVQTLREMVRELNLAPRFETYLRERVSDPQGRHFRHSAMRLQQARMRVDANTARVSGYLPEEHAIFADDREERGYRMVEAVLDSPVAATRRPVGGHRISVRQLVYQGAVVSDVLVIGVRDARSSSRVVLYTPGAPDGRPFREFRDRATAGHEFVYSPTFQAYLLDRLPAEYGEPLPNGSGRRFKVSNATRQARWVLAAPGDGRGTITEEPFDERVIDGDVRTALFDAEIVKQARDVAWMGRSTAQANWEAGAAMFSGAVRGLRGPDILVENTLGAVGQALRATWQFYDSVKAGDHGQAFVDFTQAYTSSLSLAGWHPGASGTMRRALSLRLVGNAPGRGDAGIRLPDVRQRLDTRYVVRDVDLGGTRPDSLGVHRVNGRHYIRQGDTVFELRRDMSSGTWRLVHPNALDAAFPGPALEPTLAGGWRLRMDVGLPGGWVDDAAFPQPLTRGVSGQDLQGLTDFQRWTFQQSLMARLRNGGEANLIYWEATARSHPRFVTLRQRTAWNDALRTARSTPAAPIPLGAQPAPGAPWRVLTPDEWPAALWYYPRGIGVVPASGGQMVLSLQAVPGSGLIGLPVTTQAPTNAGGSAWIRLHLDRFRHRQGTPDSPRLRIIEDRRGPMPTYVVQPDAGSPISFLGLDAGDFTAGGWAPP